MRAFLRAEWRKLIMANYEIDPGVLQSYLPIGVELDPWEGRHLVSLVGFLFKDTRVLGIRWPGHTTFPEVNLRFYVRRKLADGRWRRGVVFIQEVVQPPLIPLVANNLYNERYVRMPVTYHWETDSATPRITYHWENQSGTNKLTVQHSPDFGPMTPGSSEEFIFEHYWGYSRRNARKTVEYQVDHPSWTIAPVLDAAISVDFVVQYGSTIANAMATEPESIFFAEGSAVAIGRSRASITAR